MQLQHFPAAGLDVFGLVGISLPVLLRLLGDDGRHGVGPRLDAWVQRQEVLDVRRVLAHHHLAVRGRDRGHRLPRHSRVRYAMRT